MLFSVHQEQTTSASPPPPSFAVTTPQNSGGFPRFHKLFPRFVPIGALILLLCIALPFHAWAWPADTEWISLTQGGSTLHDPDNDWNNSTNVVPSSGTAAAAYIYADQSYLFYRLRLDDDPTGTGGQGTLQQFGWGFEIDTDQNADDYEWLVLVDGISNPAMVAIRENTVKGYVGHPGDAAESMVAAYPLTGNHRVSLADTAINGDPDYFLDFRIPYQVFLDATRLDANSFIRYLPGASTSANNKLPTSGGDLVSGVDGCVTLYCGLGDYFTPDGYLPPSMTFADGSVRFVDTLDGINDILAASIGDRLYLRVDDADQNQATNPAGLLRVELTTSRGDREVLLLKATGVAGKYTGSLPTAGGGVNDVDGTLQIAAGDTVTVTYLDSIAANGSQNIPHTDTLLVVGAKLSLAKTVDKLYPLTGDALQYRIIVSNAGPGTANNTVVSDLLPAGLQYVSNPAVAGITPADTNADAIPDRWTIASLAAGSSVTITLNCTVTAGNGSTITNNAAITTPLPSLSATATSYVGPTDLEVTKSVDNLTPNPNDNVVFTLHVVNLGPNPVPTVTVDDVLDPRLQLVSTSGDGVYNGVTWNYNAPLAANQALTLLVTAKVIGGVGASIPNIATLASAGGDINPVNDRAEVDLQVGAYDLKIAKTVNTPSPGPTEQIYYDITVKNLGPNSAPNTLEVKDLLPAGKMTYNGYLLNPVTAGCNGAAPTPAGVYDAATGIWSLGASIGSLTADASVTLRLCATLSATAGETITNATAITAPADGAGGISGDTNRFNNKASVEIAVGGTDIQVTKAVHLGSTSTDPWYPVVSAGAGSTIQYRITVKNLGPRDATGISITDILPKGVIFGSYTTAPAFGSYDGAGNNASGIWQPVMTSGGTAGSLPCGDPTQAGCSCNATLNPGCDTATLYIVATIDTGNGTPIGTVVNNAFLTAINQADPNSANNYGSARIAVRAADLALTKTVNNTTPTVNEFIAYDLKLENKSGVTSYLTQVTDYFPPELEYLGFYTAPPTSPPPANCVGATNNAAVYDPGSGLWTIGTLAVGGSARIWPCAKVKATDHQLTITNTARITRSRDSGNNYNLGDPDSTNNLAQVSITVYATDVEVDKSVSNPTPTEGTNVVYTVTVTNKGSIPASGIQIEDLLPPGLTLQAATATFRNDTPVPAVYSAGVWLVTTSLEPAGAASNADRAILTLTAKVDAGTSGQTIVNTARLLRMNQVDRDAANNAASVVITPFVIPNVTVVKLATTLSDPIHDAADPYDIPGAILRYTLIVTNFSAFALDNDSVILTDPLPPEIALVTGEPVVSISNNPGTTGLTINYSNRSDLGDQVEFSTDGSNYNYQPIQDGNNTDPAVKYLRIRSKGIFKAAAGGVNPGFSINFNVRIK